MKNLFILIMLLLPLMVLGQKHPKVDKHKDTSMSNWIKAKDTNPYKMTVPTPKKQFNYEEWKAEQRAITQRQLDYSNSAEFKRQHGSGKDNPYSVGEQGSSSFVGSKDDPFKDIRNMNLTPTKSTTNYDITISSGSSFDRSSTQTYNVIIRK